MEAGGGTGTSQSTGATGAGARGGGTSGAHTVDASAAALSVVDLPSWEPSDPIVSLAAGHAHSVALTASGRVFTWAHLASSRSISLHLALSCTMSIYLLLISLHQVGEQ